MKKISIIFLVIVLFLLFILFLFFSQNKKETPIAGQEGKNSVLGLLDSKVEEVKEATQDFISDVTAKTKEIITQNTNTLQSEEEEEVKDEGKNSGDENENNNEEEDKTTVEKKTDLDYVEEKIDFIEKSIEDGNASSSETISATFLPELVNFFGIDELAKVFENVTSVEFNNVTIKDNEATADAKIEKLGEIKSYKTYFYKIDGNWYLYKTE